MAQNIDGVNGGAVCNIEGRPSESGGLMEGNNKALKKGPWTTAEDQILIDCVRKQGEGNWNSLRTNSRLNRCGKSCRLRWANHLHPNLKKGAFAPEEERLILQLHAKYGNKWARMASQLPGRTDNEIKNYWNTRVKRRQRKGLPQYPDDIKQSHSHSHSQPTTPSIPIGPATTTIPPTVPSFYFPFHTSSSQTHLPPISTNPSHQSPALSSSHQPEYTLNHSLPLFDPATSSFSTSVPSFTFHRPTPMLRSPLGYIQYRDNVGFSPPISPTPKQSSSILRTSSMPDVVSYQQFAASTNSMPDMSFFQFQPRSFNESLVPFPGTSTQIDFGDSFFIESELPSCKLSQTPEPLSSQVSQTPEPLSSQVSQTQSLSEIIIDGNINATVVMATNETHCTSNWFLEELLQEAEALNNSLLVTQYAEMKPIQDHENEMSMPEDLSKQSNFISSTKPVSHWYSSDIGDLSNSQSSGVTETSLNRIKKEKEKKETSLKFDMQQRMASIVASIDNINDRVPHSWDNLPETPVEVS